MLRTSYSVVFLLLIIGLFFCGVSCMRNGKKVPKAVALLEWPLLAPVTGNLIIISSSRPGFTLAGSYILFVGMDHSIIALLHFSVEYCKGAGKGQKVPKALYVILGLDILQILADIFTHHVFTLEEIMVEDMPYFRPYPSWGMYLHRAVDLGIMLSVMLVYVVIIRRTSRINREKYSVIFGVMVAVTLWQMFYIFSGSPIDRSMIGFGIYGLLVYYFAVHYRPVRLLDRMLSEVVSDMEDALFLFDPAMECFWANRKGQELTGLSDSETEKMPDRLGEVLGRNHLSADMKNLKVVTGTADQVRYYTVNMIAFRENDSRFSGHLLRISDDTREQRRIRNEIYNATHDTLTDLYTREYLYERIRYTLDKNPRVPYYIVFVDVKNFKLVNDVFSAAFGDCALMQVADLIRRNMSKRCVYGRLAGDTFGVLVPCDEFDKNALDRELESFTVSSGGVEYHLVIHLGVYRSSGIITDVSVMFDRAHLALSSITDDYMTHIAFYDDRLRESVLWAQQISSELDRALTGMQLRPYLQPIADTHGHIIGAEALARWIHPVFGFMSPAAFIPVFEKNGMIVEVDRHMWRCACEILSRWDNDMFISVNISPKDFYFIDVAAELKSLVKQYGVSPSRLRIEITETVMMDEPRSRMKILDDLRQYGFIVEMDDFGSGYSSLSMLKDMPVDVLKIDMRFLSETDSEQKSRTIIRNMIRLSDELGIAALTEGVETKDQYAFLSDMGCKLFQGFYFARPMPVDDFESSFLDQAPRRL